VRFAFLGGIQLLVGGVDSPDVEFKFEVHRRVIEAPDRGKGNQQTFGDVGKGQADLEGRVGDLQVPILMLDDDGHQLGIFFAQPRGNAHTRRGGQEGDEEMMLARKAGLDDLADYLADHAAQRLLRENIVTDKVLAHCGVLNSRSCGGGGRFKRTP